MLLVQLIEPSKYLEGDGELLWVDARSDDARGAVCSLIPGGHIRL